MFPPIELFGKTIGLYQLLAIAGLFASGIYACRVCRKTGHDDNEAIVFLLFVSIGVLLGGHLLYGILNLRIIVFVINNFSAINSWRIAIDVFVEIFGGSVFYGGLLGGLLVSAVYFYKKPEQKYLADVVTPAIPLFHFFGRMGCFFGGCCYGFESSFGFTYHHSLVESANGVSRFPVQLAEALFNICLFFVLDYMRKKDLFKDRLLYAYLIIYPTARFFLEFLRGDEYRGFFLGLSTSQIISIILLGVVTGIGLKRKAFVRACI